MAKQVGVRFSGRRSCATIFFGLILLSLLLWQAIPPVQKLMSSRYTTRGSEQLTSLNFSEAVASFTRATSLDEGNVLARKQLLLAQAGETDISLLREYMSEHGRMDIVTKIDEATYPYATPKEALAAGIAYVLARDYVYARYPLELATSLDANYPEALHFLALTYDALAEFDASYQEKAAQVREKRDLLTPKWIGS
ncbi:hypothetical protein BH11PAT4_BH11PAT4_0890 [soil metagenome]